MHYFFETIVDKAVEAMLRSTHLFRNAMPKKTKKAKLIAEYRRKLQQMEVAPHVPSKSVEFIQPTTFTLPVTTPLKTPNASVIFPMEEANAIRKELFRTLIVVSLFLVFEFVLSKVI